MKIVFFGSSINSANFLEMAVKNGLKINLVVSTPPKPVGKKKIITENPTVSAAKKLGVPYLEKLRELESYKGLKLGIILDYNRIIPNSVIDLFEKGIINIHFSKLPQYRGPAPVQQTILDGNPEAWISYFLISERLDEGDILFESNEPLSPSENTQSLYQKLSKKASEEIKKVTEDYLSGSLSPKPQQGNPSFTHKLTIDSCQVDSSQTDEQKERLIRACSPEPGAWTEIRLSKENEQNKKRLKILKAHLENGFLVFDQVQLEGKNPVTWKQFKEGYPDSEIINWSLKIK